MGPAVEHRLRVGEKFFVRKRSLLDKASEALDVKERRLEDPAAVMRREGAPLIVAGAHALLDRVSGEPRRAREVSDGGGEKRRKRRLHRPWRPGLQPAQRQFLVDVENVAQRQEDARDLCGNQPVS